MGIWPEFIACLYILASQKAFCRIIKKMLILMYLIKKLQIKTRMLMLEFMKYQL